MARPINKKLKLQIKEARAAGATIEDLCEKFHLSRNTVFYHLRTDQDGRMRYTDEQRRKLAGLTAEQLRLVAAKTGRSFLALSRVASREKKRRREEARTRIILQDFLDFTQESDLRLFGFSAVEVVLANKVLNPYGLVLQAPNILAHGASGKWQELSLDEQETLLRSAADFLRSHAPVIKTRWKDKR